MTAGDVCRLALRSLAGYRLRSVLVLTAMSIGVAAVVILTSLGEGARRFVTGEFASLGTNLLITLPGRSETTGGAPPLLGETPRDLTIGDAIAISKCPSVRRVAPVVLGTSSISRGARNREILVFGSTHEFKVIRHLVIDAGQFIPPGDLDRGVPVCVIGQKVKRELFGSERALGESIRLGDRRFRVVGLVGPKGRSLGFDMDDMVTIHVASAQALFDTPALFRVLVEARSDSDIEAARRCILSTVAERHEGEDDVTIITQDAVLSTFDRILSTLTFGIGGIAAVSLVVAGILVMNVMLVSVSERTPEVGLLKALGATRQAILALFLAEGVLLSLAGGGLGVLGGLAVVRVVGWAYPAFPVGTPIWAPVSALAIAVTTGLLFTALPTSRAAALEPVTSLSRR